MTHHSENSGNMNGYSMLTQIERNISSKIFKYSILSDSEIRTHSDMDFNYHSGI